MAHESPAEHARRTGHTVGYADGRWRCVQCDYADLMDRLTDQIFRRDATLLDRLAKENR